MGSLNRRGIWCGTSDFGRTKESVQERVDMLFEAGFNLLLVHVKGGEGYIYWPSEKFADVVAPGYEEFDFPAVILEACEKRGMKLHAWFIDYFEGSHGTVYGAHPEWAALSPQGKTSNTEPLRGGHYGPLWMCPAQRPGYTDQWLVPIYEEFASKYAWEAVHHDYIRYPGDVAPDQYCFCDFCLENIPKWAGYRTEAFPDERFFHEKYDRPYLEAHWEQSPTVLPANWSSLDRSSKSRFLLDGSFFQGGRYDLDYFFYAYRIHWICQFAIESAAAVKRVRPDMKVSAAVFKNPIHSGRFIGQDWRTFVGHVDHFLPMDYRDHFPGDFDTYLTLLKETIQNQKHWSAGAEALWPGFAINFLYYEEDKANEPRRGEKFEGVVEAIRSTDVDGLAVFSDSQLVNYGLLETAKNCLQ